MIIGLSSRNLTTRVALSFIGIVIITALIIGTPAIWILRLQLDRLAWSQISQGQRAVQALYVSQRKQVIQLATLTSQRPTLANLLSAGDRSAASKYLYTLQSGAGLDFIMVCTSENAPFASTSPPRSQRTYVVGMMGILSSYRVERNYPKHGCWRLIPLGLRYRNRVV